jgi:Rrf2 family protein
MLRPTKKAALAVEAVLDIACHPGPEPVQSMDIAGRLDLPRRYLEQVMQQLVRAGILKGVRGPRGGYRLAREQRRISVGDILRIVTGDVEGEEAAAASQSPLGARVMAPFWAGIERDLMEGLDAVSIEDLRQSADREGLGAPSEKVQDFAI